MQVLKSSRVRSVLVECCTLSNQCQFNDITQSGNQGLIADGIATGISNYLGLGLHSPGPPEEGTRVDSRVAVPYSIVAPARTLVGPLQEGFEGSTFPPSGWTMTSSGASPPFTWHRTTDPLDVSAGIGAARVDGGYATAIDEWLISPMFRVSAADSTLRFRWLGNPNFAGNVMGSCAVRRKGESTWTNVWSLSQENVGLVFSYPARTVGLSAWLGDSVQVSFRVVGTNGADFTIDDIATGLFQVTGAPPNDLCQFATPLPAGSFAFSGSTCYAANDRDPTGNPCVAVDAAGGDVFYSLNALVGDTLQVHLNDASAAFTQLYLLSSCDSLSATCLIGEQPSGGEIDSTLTYIFTTAGTYYLAVDAMGGSCGDFVLSGTWRGPVTAVEGPPVTESNGLSLLVSPNPTRGGAIRFAGQVQAGLRGMALLRIFDAAGRVVHSERLSVAGDRFEVSWNGHSLAGPRIAAGRYIARFELAGKATSTPFVFTN